MNVKEVGELVNKHKILSARLNELQKALEQMSRSDFETEPPMGCSIQVLHAEASDSVKVECSKDVAEPYLEAEAAKVEREIQAINQLFLTNHSKRSAGLKTVETELIDVDLKEIVPALRRKDWAPRMAESTEAFFAMLWLKLQEEGLKPTAMRFRIEMDGE